jgi:hypothetical protein
MTTLRCEKCGLELKQCFEIESAARNGNPMATTSRPGHPGYDVRGPAVPTAAGYHKSLDDVHRQLERVIGLLEDLLRAKTSEAPGR